MKKSSKSDTAIPRQKAEDLLKKKLSGLVSQHSKTEILKLIHELELHQTELEIQNEELIGAISTKQKTIEKYTALFDFAPLGYFILSQNGKIIELNLCGSQMLGKECSCLKNSQFDLFISNDTRPLFSLFLGKVFDNKTKESCDVTLSSVDILPRNAHLSGIVSKNGEQCFITMLIITAYKQAEELEKYRYRLQELVKERTAELQSNNLKLAREIVDRRQAEKALAESEQKFRDIAQNVPGTIFQLRVRPDGSNYFSYLSPRAADIFELPLEQPNFEWSLSNHIHPDDRAGFLASVARVINERLDWNYEGRIVKSNGEIKWFHGFTSQNYVGDEMVLDGIMLDITERKMTEQSLKDSVKQYKALFSSMTEAFMLCEIITDKKDDPVDFRFLEMNDAWETQTGIKIEQARGKTVREVIPDVETGWIKRCGNVVKTGVPVQFEEYNVSTNRFYSIHSFKTKDNQFGAVFSAITKREKVEPSPR